jgi:hypothetical protein
METRGLAGGFAAWPTGEDAPIDAVECVILAHWNPADGDPAGEIVDEDVSELYRVYRDLTVWAPTAAEKTAARPPN